MDEQVRNALKETSDRFVQFSRNGRWGTCCDCPRDIAGRIYPEFCEHTKRADHHLDVDSLAKNYKVVVGR